MRKGGSYKYFLISFVKEHIGGNRSSLALLGYLSYSKNLSCALEEGGAPSGEGALGMNLAFFIRYLVL